MSGNSSIQVKAVFLLLVFSLNTIIGFACAAGLNMGFNSKHHHHPDDEQGPSANGSHHLEISTALHEEELNNNYKSSDEDNCCNSSVIRFMQSDKLLTHVINAGIEIPATLKLTHSLYSFYLAPVAKTTSQTRVFRHGFFNSPDIRVSIRSFQI